MPKVGYVYLLTNSRNTVIYTGVTSDLRKRIYEHKHKLIEGFTKKYDLTKLVFVEKFNDINEAIAAEKLIKGKSRQFKVDLIISQNPKWEDLSL